MNVARTIPIALAALVLTSIAAASVSEKTTLFRGSDVDSHGGMTFNGTTFDVPGHTPIPKKDVNSVEFQPSGEAAAANAGPAGPNVLTPLAKAQLAKGAALAKKYAGAPGVILVDDGVFVYHKDGTNSYHYHFAGLVLKDERKSWAQISVGFEQGRSRAHILYGRAISPDGTVTSLSQDAIKISSPSQQMQFFDPNQKVMSGVIPGVQVGSIVEYEYDFDYYNPEDPRLFSPGYRFQSDEPVVLTRVRVDLPKDTTFHYETRNFPAGVSGEPKIQHSGDIESYTWQLDDVPPVTPEPAMPPESDIVPSMQGSIFKNFQAVYDLLKRLQEARLQTTPQIEKKVKEITAGATDLNEKIARIYYWVQQNTRYISIKGSLGAGFSGHTAQETFENRYGDCTDKSILLSTMLKCIGVPAYPVILTTNDVGMTTTKIPTLSGNHCITEVCPGDRDFYLDGTAENYRYPYFRGDDHGAYAMNAILGHIKQIPVPPPADDRRKSQLQVTLQPNGDATVKTTNAYNGNYEAGVRGFWKQTRQDNRKPLMAQYVNSIAPGAILQGFTLTNLNDLSVPLVMTIDYKLPQLAIRAKDLLYFHVPTLEHDFPEASLETRKYPVQYMTTVQRDLDVDIAIPDGFHEKWFAPPLDIKNPYVEYHGKYEVRDGKIHFHESYLRLKRIVPVKDYPAFRDALRAIAAFSKKEVFLTEKEK